VEPPEPADGVPDGLAIGTPDSPGRGVGVGVAVGVGLAVGRGVGVGRGSGKLGNGTLGSGSDGSGRMGVALGRGVCVAVGAGVGGGVACGVGVAAGVGLGVGAGVGVGVGVGVGPIGMATLSVMPSVGKIPEPQSVPPLEPGLSWARPVHVVSPVAVGVPVIRNTARSPTGSPTSGLLSDGFWNLTRTPPPIGPVDACQPWPDADPLTVTIATEPIEKELGTSI
jgi:hypothetical protein